jgi:hypothetical protein
MLQFHITRPHASNRGALYILITRIIEKGPESSQMYLFQISRFNWIEHYTEEGESLVRFGDQIALRYIFHRLDVDTTQKNIQSRVGVIPRVSAVEERLGIRVLQQRSRGALNQLFTLIMPSILHHHHRVHCN